ncbi:hypothetical protein CEXT_607561 [Caerostris extrusa]|uniref:Uncharacterized protein n=1 Tax=Caerostris extrusa TaxID=172846 RepID=A0AAV4VPQ0_CAEEX|nr:hypothetical protein CEXT_607561 [Caerostris extrusa]
MNWPPGRRQEAGLKQSDHSAAVCSCRSDLGESAPPWETNHNRNTLDNVYCSLPKFVNRCQRQRFNKQPCKPFNVKWSIYPRAECINNGDLKFSDRACSASGFHQPRLAFSAGE